MSVVMSLLVLVGLSAVSCGPSQIELDAQATAVAVRVLAPLTAQAPTAPPTFTPTATATSTPTRTLTPNRTSTHTATAKPIATRTRTPTRKPAATRKPTVPPPPVAIVIGTEINVHEGPGTEYAMQGRMSTNEELDVIGQYRNCAWLKVVSRKQAVRGWIPADPQALALQKSCADIPAGTFRPLTGVIKPNPQASGKGELTVENGTAKDGVVILTRNETPVTAAYIRTGESIMLTGIEDGIYILYFSTGSDWAGEAFLTAPSHKRFEDTFPFTTDATTYTTWRVTLHGVVGGTAGADDVNPGDFPKIGD